MFRSIFSLVFFFLFVSGVNAQQIEQLKFEDGLQRLLKNNAKILQGNAQLLSFQALYDQADNASLPKISMLAFVAPMFQLQGNALQDQRDYTKWGPLFRGEIDVTLPLFSFGRLSNAKTAATFGVEVGKNLKESSINEQIFEYKKMYLSSILLKRLKTVLDEAEEKITDIVQRAELAYAEGVGEVQRKDLTRLKLFAFELEKFQTEWEINRKSARRALGHFLGSPDDFDVTDADFPVIDEAPALEALIRLGFEKNPNLKAVSSGVQARTHQLKMEEGAMLPVIFIATRVEGTYTNMAERQTSVFAFDPFNTVYGGVVLGSRWQLDWSETAGKTGAAKSELEAILAQKKEAETGIPLKIALAYWELKKQRIFWNISQKKYKESTGWAVSELSSYGAGVGDSKDLLEAYGAFLLARKDMAEAEFNYCIAWAKLAYEVGEANMLRSWVEREIDED